MPGRVPPGGKLYAPTSGGLFVVFDIGGAIVWYEMPGIGNYDLAGYQFPQPIDPTEFDRLVHGPNAIAGGDVAELASIPAGQTFQGWIDEQLNTATGGAEWVRDPEMRAIYADVVTNRDRYAQNPLELESRIKQSNYWKSRSSGQAAFNDLSPAEQNLRTQEEAANLIGQVFRFTGESLSLGDPELQQYARQLAEGAATLGALTETWIKPRALAIPNSPWARTIAEEKQNQNQVVVNVENLAEKVRDMYRRWVGPAVSEDTIQHWAKGIANGESSDADLLQHLQKQSEILYPWKDPAVETMVAAEPWLQTYARVLERGVPSLDNPHVQEALANGQAPYEFEKALKSRPEWLETKNAEQTLIASASGLGQKLGFV